VFETLSNFHFIRPLWLLVLIPAGLLSWTQWRRLDPVKRFSSLVAPHLARYLITTSGRAARLRPVLFLLPAWVLATLAVAGPTCRREISPFADDQAVVIVALDLSQTMNASDIQPSRLERAKQKIRDLLRQREGARTGLIVYAGSAHMVMPPTDDSNILETYLESITTSIMPLPGRASAEALTLASSMLDREPVPGTVLFITDSIGQQDQVGAFSEYARQSRNQIICLAVGTSDGGPVLGENGKFLTDTSGQPVVAEFNQDGFATLSRQAGVDIVDVTVDDSDVRRVNRRTASHLVEVQNEDPARRWVDYGYFLVFPTAALAGCWLRKGWIIRWQ